MAVRAIAVVVMGVSGNGKTTVGRLLAHDLGWAFVDADDIHPRANIEKMSRGEPLTDADRGPWLDALAATLSDFLAREQSVVLACSALKQAYRDRLRVDDRVSFVYLKGDTELLRRRLAERRGHFFAPALLDSQLDVLEEPSNAMVLDAAAPPEDLVREIERGLSRP